jgi:phenylacetate-CoA ligase
MAAVAKEYLDRPALNELQRQRLCAVLREILPANRFYARKFAAAGVTAGEVTDVAGLGRLPFTTKAELMADQAEHPPYGTVLTYPRERYSRLHQTSGTTTGQPLRWLDTPESWRWLLGCWEIMYRIAGVRPDDRLFFAFSFGPFLFGWTASDGAALRGNFFLPGGGMSSSARLRFLLDNAATIVLGTPTYALRLAEVAAAQGIDLADSSVRAVIVGGEPGGSIAPTRRRIEEAWGARVFDHAGMTEVGCLMMACPENPGGLHLLESECIAEVIDPVTTDLVPPGQAGELVLTNLGRWGSPALRYRTGDLVRVDPRPCSCGRTFLRLDGGILGRTDEMIHFRGNNVYPSALEAVIRRFPEVAEYRIEVETLRTLPVLRIQLEPVTPEAGPGVAERVDRAVRDELLFRAEVTVVEPGTLPRFEMKARRLIRR